MRRLIASTFASLLATTPFGNPVLADPPLAEDASQLLVGTWYSVIVGSSVLYYEKTYFADGTACGFNLESPDEVFPAAFSTFKSTWRLDGTTLTSTVTETSSPYLTVGERIVDELVSIDADQHVLRPIGTQDLDYRYKVKEPRGRKLCEFPSDEEPPQWPRTKPDSPVEALQTTSPREPVNSSAPTARS